MRTLSFYIRLYFAIISQYIKVRMQYRADFFVSSFGMAAQSAVGVFTLWVLFKSVSNLEGWGYYELIFIYAFSLLAIIPRQLLFDNIWSLGDRIREGSFIKYYFRPLNIMFYYVSEVFDLKGLGQLALAIWAFIYSSTKLGLEWNFFKIALLGLSLFSSSLIMTSVLIIAGSTGFWTMQSHSILMFAYKFEAFSRYPVTIFNNFFRFLFTYVIPIGFIAFYPSQLFLRPANTNALILFSPIAGIVMFVIAYMVWNRGVRIYSGTGS